MCEGVPRAVRGVLAETVSRCVGSALAVAIVAYGKLAVASPMDARQEETPF